jgi:hypothetical protein
VLHNKPEDCGASVASAAGPFKKKRRFRTEFWGDYLVVKRSNGRMEKIHSGQLHIIYSLQNVGKISKEW